MRRVTQKCVESVGTIPLAWSATSQNQLTNVAAPLSTKQCGLDRSSLDPPLSRHVQEGKCTETSDEHPDTALSTTGAPLRPAVSVGVRREVADLLMKEWGVVIFCNLLPCASFVHTVATRAARYLPQSNTLPTRCNDGSTPWHATAEAPPVPPTHPHPPKDIRSVHPICSSSNNTRTNKCHKCYGTRGTRAARRSRTCRCHGACVVGCRRWPPGPCRR
jgi:hypothetical protein